MAAPSTDAPEGLTAGGVGLAFGTLAVLLVSLAANSRILFGIVLGAAIFIPLERLLALHPQRVFRAGWRTDLVHLIANQLLTLLGLFVGVIVVGLSVRWATPQAVREAVAGQPGWLQFAEAYALAELCAYWIHRASHEVPYLWRFHKVHHSIAEMDWLAAGHLHPIDQAITRTVVVVPLFALGFSRATFGWFLTVQLLLAIFSHANVRVRFGPLRYVIVTPHYHHWHHADEVEAHGRNLGLPVLDWAFGTLHLPERWPVRYGTAEQQPAGYLRQLAWPFRTEPAASALPPPPARPRPAPPSPVWRSTLPPPPNRPLDLRPPPPVGVRRSDEVVAGHHP